MERRQNKSKMRIRLVKRMSIKTNRDTVFRQIGTTKLVLYSTSTKEVK